MSNGFLGRAKHRWRISHRVVAALWTSGSLVSQCWLAPTAQAETAAYCKFTNEAIAQKETLRLNALKGNPDSDNRYKAILKQHGDSLRQCRTRTWPNDQAVWLRLYPCDIRPGGLD
ncbi:MAG TPA: hypothetical protein DCL61_24380, partial [Cyanobacteria bacterium UBA12227]|nr:hypothetical protein [Cyanobacteria bacterium UBA12227]